jgi:hypothetical protein
MAAMKTTIWNSRRNPAIASVLAAGLLLSACSPTAKPAAGPDISGTYTLVSVDGKPVPAKLTHENVAVEVRSGTFTINADGTCGTKTVFVPPTGREGTREVTATYTRDGSKLTMKWNGAGMNTGVVASNTFTMDNEGMLFVYRH